MLSGLRGARVPPSPTWNTLPSLFRPDITRGTGNAPRRTITQQLRASTPRTIHGQAIPSPATAFRPKSVRHIRGQRYNSTQGPVRQKIQQHAPDGIQAKLKELSRKYGWAAVGVYLGLSALDFPFCFLAVQMLGPERVGQAEHFVVDRFWRLVGLVTPSGMTQATEAMPSVEEAAARDGPVVEAVKNKDGATIWAQLLLAYGVHKSLIFFRVPLAAAVTPKVVKFLRARGWKIGKEVK